MRDPRRLPGGRVARVFAEGQRASEGELSVVFRRREDTRGERFAFAVTRRVGGAVARNRVKRRLREIGRGAKGRVRPEFDYLVLARAGAGSRDYQELERTFWKILEARRLILTEMERDDEGDS